MVSRFFAAAIGSMMCALVAVPVSAATLPTLAVTPFDIGAGVTPWWGGGFNPGDTLAEMLSDRLINAGTVIVVDRTHLKKVLAEQNTSASGEVTPATEAHLGRMLGAGYLVVGTIARFDKASQGSGVFHSLPVFGSMTGKGDNMTLHVSMQVLEVNSGRPIAALEDEQTAKATSFSLSGLQTAGGVDVTSPDFQSSAIGKMLEAAADDLAKKVETVKLPDNAAAASIAGTILGSDDGAYVLNVGTDKGVSEGMVFTTYDVKQFAQPGAAPITSYIPKGSVQVISVSKDSSIAKKMSGIVKAHQSVKSE